MRQVAEQNQSNSALESSHQSFKARPVNLSFAAYIHKTHEQSARLALAEHQAGTLQEPLLGSISLEHIQLVPQARDQLTQQKIDCIQALLPQSKLRLHANTRAHPVHLFADLVDFHQYTDYFKTLAQISNSMGAEAYSAHPGFRKNGSFDDLLDCRNRVQDLFECPVAIEPQYPSSKNLLLSTWGDHERLLRAEVPFAIDLSHLNIVVAQSKRFDRGLVKDLLSSRNCIEVHVSDNEGKADSHQQCEKPTWWQSLIAFVHEKAVIFTEGSRTLTVKSNPQLANVE